MRLRRVALVVLSTVLASTTPASAEEAVALPRLVVDRGPGAESCPDALALAAAVSAALGRPALSSAPTAAAAETTFTVEMSRGPSGFTAVLRAAGKRRGERVVSDEGASCVGLSEALATMFAMVLDAQASAVTIEVPSPVTPSPGRTAPPPAVTVPPAEQDEGATLPADPLRIDAVASLALARGLLPATAAGVHGEIRLRARSAFVFGPGILYLPGRERSHPPGVVDVSLVSGSVFGCYLPLDRPTLPRVSVCLEPMAGALHGSGRGYVTPPQAVTRPWLALGAGLRVDGGIGGPFAWTVGGTIVAPITRERLAVTGLGLVHDPPPVAFVGTLGVRATFR